MPSCFISLYYFISCYLATILERSVTFICWSSCSRLISSTRWLIYPFCFWHLFFVHSGRAVFIEPRAPGENRSWGPSFPFFCLKTRFFFQKKILKKSIFFLRRSSFVEAPSASDPWQPPGSPGGKDGPVLFSIKKQKFLPV